MLLQDQPHHVGFIGSCHHHHLSPGVQHPPQLRHITIQRQELFAGQMAVESRPLLVLQDDPPLPRTFCEKVRAGTAARYTWSALVTYCSAGNADRGDQGSARAYPDSALYRLSSEQIERVETAVQGSIAELTGAGENAV